ncbi:MAG: LysM peptidoglycan-binding domain-containing protein [Archangiaceae bacterium]|nr:LysM peptidoglycan-binding domain-containing protein [Archangiaceae bacterium]
MSYTIERGDTLWALAKRFHTTVAKLAELNHISNPNLIIAGRTLQIPGQSDNFSSEPTNPGSPTPSTPVSGIENRPNVKGSAEQAINFFMSKGLTRAQAAGIASNLFYESGFRPDAVGDGGTSFGIAQWHNGRGDAMKQWTARARLLAHLVQGPARVPLARAEPQREQRAQQAARHQLGLRRRHGLSAVLRAPGGHQPGARPDGAELLQPALDEGRVRCARCTVRWRPRCRLPRYPGRGACAA